MPKGLKSFLNQLDGFTKIIVGINIIFYIISVIYNGASALTGLSRNQMLQTFGMTGDNGVIPVITSMFMHASLGHFIMNMGTLLLFSPIVTKYFPISYYATTYLLSGVIGNVVTRYLDPDMVTMGASGAIYGVMGMLFVAVISSNFVKYFEGLKEMTLMIFIIIGINVFMTFNYPNINILAHLSGLFIGVVIAIARLLRIRKSN